jgi:aminoglycoside 6-adenylyltransferase
MMTWYFGIRTDFKVNPGKFGKNFSNHIEPEFCNLLAKTCSDSEVSHTWHSLESACLLFRDLGVKVALNYGFEYPSQDDERVSAYLKHVKGLSSDSQVIY